MPAASTGGGGGRPQSIPSAWSVFKRRASVEAPKHLRRARALRVKARKVRYHRLRVR